MKHIILGSRSSELATWQVEHAKQLLHTAGYHSIIEYIQSQGDLIQDKPLHNIGISGVFTKALDDALLAGTIDAAVHSCKDLPTILHDELCIAAYLQREESQDVIVTNGLLEFSSNYTGILATGSVRRKAQLLAVFPQAQIVDLRGNVPTRLCKLKESNWGGAVFAAAGLKRLCIVPKTVVPASFMLPAPAQGVVAIVCRKTDKKVVDALRAINHLQSGIAAQVERTFLRLMEGGCISPIAAHCEVAQDALSLTIQVLSVDGSRQVSLSMQYPMAQWDKLAFDVYKKACEQGAKELIAYSH